MLSVCPHDCPSCCSLVVTVEAGRLTSVTGNPEHPFTRGVICGKVREYAERVHSPLRVLTPLRRVGAKGAGEFAAISWRSIQSPPGGGTSSRPTAPGRSCR